MTKSRLLLLLAIAITSVTVGCSDGASSEEPQPGKPAVVTLAEDQSAPAVPVPRPKSPTPPDFTYWPPATLDSGTARVSCHYDYDREGDGERIGALEMQTLSVTDNRALLLHHFGSVPRLVGGDDELAGLLGSPKKP